MRHACFARRQRNALAVLAFGLATFSAALPPAARAATPEAWAAHERDVAASCIAASALRGARPAGRVIDFDDRLGLSALLIAGRHAASHMKGRRARELCLFDRRSRQATLAPADALDLPRPR